MIRGTAAPQRRGSRLLVIAVLTLVVLSAGWWLWPQPASAPAPALRRADGPVAEPAPADTVVALGRLVPRSRIVTVAPPFGSGDARLAEVLVAEGERVAAGTLLARLDNQPALSAALAVAEATLAAREAGLDQARVSVLSQRDDARASLQRALAAIEIAERDLGRATDLQARGAATPQVADQRRVVLTQARADAARARAALQRYDTPDIETQADVVVAHRAIESAAADVARARADLDRTAIRAPFPGTVLTIYARAGERPSALGILTFGDLEDMIAEVEVYETHLHRLRPGQRVSLSAVALPTTLAGRVERIGTEILRQSLTDASPAANTDGRVGRVVIRLEGDAAAIAGRVAGLQVLARIQLSP